MGVYQCQKAGAGKVLNVDVTPDSVHADANATAIQVGKGNICRIEGTAGGFIVFGKDASVAVPDVNTATALKTEAGFFYVRAQEDYIRTSAAMRIEVIKD